MTVTWLEGKFPPIPAISEVKLQELFSRIKPIVRLDNGNFHRVLHTDLRGTSFLWDQNFSEDPLSVKLVEVAGILTYHTAGFGLLFKPSIAEVMAQIPEKYLDQISYFETLSGPTVEVYADHNGHRTLTMLYKEDK